MHLPIQGFGNHYNRYGTQNSYRHQHPSMYGPQRTYSSPKVNPMQHLRNSMSNMFQRAGRSIQNSIYGFAKKHPVMYGAGVAGASVGTGMMSCPYAGASVAAAGAYGFNQAQHLAS